MQKMLTQTAGLTAAVMMCAGWWAYGQNQQSAPKRSAEKASAVAPTTETPKDQEADNADERAIRDGADAFRNLYNAHDAKGLAALFADKAEMVDEDGKLVKGRDAIEAEFAQQFQDQPDCTMRVDVAEVRVLTPHLALEEGTARCAGGPGEPEEITNYTCVHVKTDGKWQLASVTDFAAVPEDLTPHEQLQQLSWLLGEWIDESSTSNVHSICDWDDSGNFLLTHFQVQIAGQVSMTGTTRIGWDAVAKQFRSWVFDSEGGFSEGVWVPQGDEWIVKTTGATAHGEMCSSTNVYRILDNDTFTYQSHDRVVDGQVTEDIAELVIKRRAPSPEDDAEQKSEEPAKVSAQ